MKKAGMLMPVFSLPGKYGIGTFGKEAYRFVDLLCDTGNKIWQVLPMGPTGFGDSPYQAFSAFAGNPYFIDLEMLIEDGLLDKETLEDPWEFDFGDGANLSKPRTPKPAEKDSKPAASVSVTASETSDAGSKKPAAGEDEDKLKGELSGADQAQNSKDDQPDYDPWFQADPANPDNPFRVNYGKLYVSKTKALRLAFDNYKEQGGDIKKLYKELRPETVEYCIFMAIKNNYKGASWDVWPKELKDCDDAAVKKFTKEHQDEVDFFAFCQYQFNRQWGKLHEYAKIRGIEIIGDIPIYCAPDSADAWAHRELFQYTCKGEPKKVAGVPPDVFSTTGQLWGNPLYDWKAHKKTGYKWWIDRMDYCLNMYDTLRVDHFRGFESYYAIPFGDKTAENGEWEEGPGMGLFDAMYKHYGTRNLPIIAEDLGIITDEVRKLMAETGFPGMKILEFAWDSGPENAYLPHRLETQNCVYYTGTHDNDTLRHWFETLPDWTRNYMYMYMSRSHNDWKYMPELLIRLSMSTIADTVIVPVADYLNLGAEARINQPGTSLNNWQWRMKEDAFNDADKRKISEIVGVYGRYIKANPVPAPDEESSEEGVSSENVVDA